MITGINKQKTLIKHLSCECKCLFDEKNVIHINGRITINIDVSAKKSNDEAKLYDKTSFNEKKVTCKT